MRPALMGLLGILCAIAFGITGAIWVGIYLGGWGLAVIAGVALGVLIALPLGIQVVGRMGGVGPSGASRMLELSPRWPLDTPRMEGLPPPPRGDFALPTWAWGTARHPPASFSLPLPGIPWGSWIVWIPGFSPTPLATGGPGWPTPPPTAPRTFTVIGEEQEEEE